MGYPLPSFLSEDHCSNQGVRTLIFAFDFPAFFCSVRYCSLYLTYRAITAWVNVSPIPIWCTITNFIIWGSSYFTWVLWLFYLLELLSWIPSITNTVFFNLTPDRFFVLTDSFLPWNEQNQLDQDRNFDYRSSHQTCSVKKGVLKNLADLANIWPPETIALARRN